MILLLDDNPASTRAVYLALDAEAYTVQHAPLGHGALRQLLLDEPALVILAIAPANGEWRFFRRLLALVECPLLVILPTRDDLLAAQALDLGADDCMYLPFLAAELVARVRALLRRDRAGADKRRQNYLVDGDLVVDVARREVRCNNRPVALTSTEFEVLACLVQHRGRLLRHRDLIAQVWGPQAVVSPVSLRQYISHLRQKLEPDPRHPCRIVSCWGHGYMLQTARR